MKQDQPLDTTTRVETARAAAFVALCEWSRTDLFAAAVLDTVFENNRISDLDRRLATELVYGTIRRQATLDMLLQSVMDRGKDSVETELWILLRLGAYQLVYLDSIPDHAAVAETVALAHTVQKKRWVGFANAILRNITRLLTDDYVQQPQPNAIPLKSDRHRIIQQALFADLVQQPADYISAALSYPRWLINRWLTQFGFEETLRLAYWFQQPARTCLRVNTLKINTNDVLAVLQKQNIATEPGGLPEAIWLHKAVSIASLPGFAEGWLTVQDEAAMQAGRLLNPQPGERVLDLCSAPGTKATHLAELMQNRGEIIACDIAVDRLRRIEHNTSRLDIDIIKPTLIGGDGSNIPAGLYDAILLDVPCSNTGVMQKRPEVRWRIQRNDLKELATIGKQLLMQAIEKLKPGGKLVYSTCSIEPIENEKVVQQALQACDALSLIQERKHQPGLPGDGSYQALLCKSK